MADSAKWYVVHTYSGYENAVNSVQNLDLIQLQVHRGLPAKHGNHDADPVFLRLDLLHHAGEAG